MNSKTICAVKRCTTYAMMGIPMHHFPQDENLLLQWLVALEESNISVISVHTMICGLHFKLSDYKNPHFLDLQNSEEEMEADLTISKNNAGETHERNVIGSNDENSDNACDIEKLMNIESVVEKNLIMFARKKLENEVQVTNKEVQTASTSTKSVAVQSAPYSFMDFLRKDSDLHAFAGVNCSVLRALVDSAKLVLNKVSDKSLCSLEERITLTLCKLKLGLSFRCLAVLFKISKTTASSYFEDTIHLLACVLEEAIHFPDKEEIEQNLPTCFEKFRDTRIILDCTEIPVQNSKCLQCRLKMYSHYKGRQTLKILIGITPSGLISYCSKCYGGRASDKSIFIQSGLLNKMIPGQDAIMVDKGFLISSECEECKIKLIRPPFADKSKQMSKENSLETINIAAARVHVERCIQRLKTFSILQSTIDWEMTKYFNEIMIVLCGCVNLSAPILDKCRFQPKS